METKNQNEIKLAVREANGKVARSVLPRKEVVMKNKTLVLAIAIAVFVTFSAAPTAEAFVFLFPAVFIPVLAATAGTIGIFAAIDIHKDQSKEVAVKDKRLVLSKDAMESDNDEEE